MMQASTSMNPLEAYEALTRFAQQRGEGALRLALHVAVPQSFRPDLLHLLRLNFVPEATRDPAVEADVLLAPFCEDLGGGYFQFDAEVRRLLLDELVSTYATETKGRVQRVANFLLVYIERLSRTFREQQDRVARDYLEIQRWVALAFLAPDAAAEQLAAALAQATDRQDSVVRVQLGGLVAGLSIPLVKYPQLLTYAASVQAFEAGQIEQGRDLLERLPDEDLKVGRVKLRSPHKMLGKQEIEETKADRVKRRSPHKELPEQPRKDTAFVTGDNDKSEQKVTKPTIFISCSHKDVEWREQLKTHLRALQLQDDSLTYWTDEAIGIGDAWFEKIQNAMNAASVAVMLVSPDFLASGFIIREEVRRLLERREQDQMPILPILVRPCVWKRVPWLSRLQMRPSGAEALSKGTSHQVAEALANIAEEIAEALERAGTGRTPSPVTVPATVVPVIQPPLAPTFTNSLGMEFILIPSGEFQMGSEDGFDDEKPAHLVRITKPFYLGKYQVTQGQWEAVMGNNPSHFSGNPNRPVERVSWENVQVFLQRLNEREKGKEHRLPTEAEWEYAARAGSTGAYCFGDDVSQLKEYAWYGANAQGSTHPVGQLQPNAWGLYDMHGNVAEWCHDGPRTYTSASVSDPLGPTTARADRVLRGGSWGGDARLVRSAHRFALGPGGRGVSIGFRCASSM